ncbi:MAG TPA: site-specific integrase [Planctomycetota bacterium]|nr:site-specific integrase [Planctomycetota bacterium]
MSRGRALGPGRLEKRGDAWTLVWTSEEGVRERRTVAHDRRTAEQVRAEVIRQRDLAAAGLLGEAGQTRTLGELLASYLQDLQPRVTPAHLQNVGQRLSWIVNELGADTRIRDLRAPEIAAIRNQLRAEGRSPRTCNLLVDRLGAMFRWAVAQELVAVNPVAKIKRLPDGEGNRAYERRALTGEEIERLLEAARAEDAEVGVARAFIGWTRVPQAPLFLMLLDSGARWNEARTLAWGDVDLQRGVVVLRAANTKARRQREIPVTERLRDALRALRPIHQRALGRMPTIADPVFLSPRAEPWPRPTTNPMRVFHRLLDRAAIPKHDLLGRKLDIHALRHTYATRLASAGVGLAQAQRLLGHSDPKLTASIYTHLDLDDLHAAVRKLDQRREPQVAERSAR